MPKITDAEKIISLQERVSTLKNINAKLLKSLTDQRNGINKELSKMRESIRDINYFSNKQSRLIYEKIDQQEKLRLSNLITFQNTLTIILNEVVMLKESINKG